MYVYGLVDPRDGQLRYVGVTRVSPEKRLLAHLRDAKQSKEQSHRIHWLRSLLNQGITPEVFVIEENPSDWKEAEPFWINYFKSIGANLVNSGGGGPGPWESPSAPGLEEFRKIVSQKLKGNKNGAGRKLSSEQKEQLRQINLGHTVSEETRRKIAKGGEKRKGRPTWNKGLHGGYWTGRHLPEEIREKISKTRKEKRIPGPWRGKTIPQAVRNKISAALTGRHPSLQTIGKLRITSTGRVQSQETKDKKLASFRKTIQDRKRGSS